MPGHLQEEERARALVAALELARQNLVDFRRHAVTSEAQRIADDALGNFSFGQAHPQQGD